MHNKAIRGSILILVSVMVVGCGVSHINEYVPKRRAYVSPVDLNAGADDNANGSLFSSRHAGTYLFADHRAMRMGDIVTIRIDEQAVAKRGAATDLGRDSSTSLEFDVLFGALKNMSKASGSGNLLDAALKTDFSGRGTTSRSDRLEATVPAVVMQVMPNGNLFVEGHRVVLVNDEEHHFYISGVVRPVDIKQDNSVTSSLIADAEIEFTGRGAISEKQKAPWLHRGLDHARPF